MHRLEWIQNSEITKQQKQNNKNITAKIKIAPTTKQRKLQNSEYQNSEKKKQRMVQNSEYYRTAPTIKQRKYKKAKIQNSEWYKSPIHITGPLTVT